MYGGGPGDMRPRAPKVEKEEEPVVTAMDEQWKWLLAAAVVAIDRLYGLAILEGDDQGQPPQAATVGD